MNPVAVLRKCSMFKETDPGRVWHALWMWCPGCDKAHQVNLEGPDGFRPEVCWDWDGNIETPTITPSILVHASGDQPTCHSFVKSGQWEFLDDCEHSLAGQTVPMVPLPDWLVN